MFIIFPVRQSAPKDGDTSLQVHRYVSTESDAVSESRSMLFPPFSVTDSRVLEALEAPPSMVAWTPDDPICNAMDEVVVVAALPAPRVTEATKLYAVRRSRV